MEIRGIHRPGYLKTDSVQPSFMSPKHLYRRWKETPCSTPWLFISIPGIHPTMKGESCETYKIMNLGQWITSDPHQCILGKELSPADQCSPHFDICGLGYDWISEIGCVRQKLRT